jgi:hypothetical protein
MKFARKSSRLKPWVIPLSAFQPLTEPAGAALSRWPRITEFEVALLKPDLLNRTRTWRRRDGHRRPLGPSSFMRMTVGSRGMFVSELSMFKSRGCVLLGVVMLAEIVVMGSLMMMMCGSVMVSGCLVMMLTRRMLR